MKIVLAAVNAKYIHSNLAVYSLRESAGEYREVAEQLTEDLTYISRVDLTGLSYPVDFYLDYRVGDLYLRCDGGNGSWNGVV